VYEPLEKPALSTVRAEVAGIKEPLALSLNEDRVSVVCGVIDQERRDGERTQRYGFSVL